MGENRMCNDCLSEVAKDIAGASVDAVRAAVAAMQRSVDEPMPAADAEQTSVPPKKAAPAEEPPLQWAHEASRDAFREHAMGQASTAQTSPQEAWNLNLVF